jgi:DUF1009 family protein
VHLFDKGYIGIMVAAGTVTFLERVRQISHANNHRIQVIY